MDLNFKGIVCSSRIDDRSGSLGASGANRWLRSAALMTLALSLSSCGLLGGGDRDSDEQIIIEV